MKYLVIDKRQRVKSSNDSTYANHRIKEELDRKGCESYFGYLDEISIQNGEYFINSSPITSFTHIIFRGHNLSNPKEYETKRSLAYYIDQYNSSKGDHKISLQNLESIKIVDKYDKLFIYSFCTKNNIPTIKSYYKPNYDYSSTPFDYPFILKIISGENDLVMIDGVEKIKKNVFLINKPEDLQQDRLKDKDLNQFLAQEYIKSGEDFRIFVSKGKVIGGFSRKSTTSFITVKSGEYSSTNIDEHKKIYELAERFSLILKADFIAVDTMINNEGIPVIQEFSFNPGFKAYETKLVSGNPTNIAKAIIESF